jgi:hypothetical protein
LSPAAACFGAMQASAMATAPHVIETLFNIEPKVKAMRRRSSGGNATKTRAAKTSMAKRRTGQKVVRPRNAVLFAMVNAEKGVTAVSKGSVTAAIKKELPSPSYPADHSSLAA